MIVHELTADDVVAEREIRRYPPLDYLDVVIAWDQVVAWRVKCKCGWTGGEQQAVTETKYGTRNCPEDFEDRVFAPEWSAHVAPFAALTDLEQLVDQLRDVETRIADTVRLARTGGASWAQVGRAAGLSKQGAQQRWSHLAPDTSGVDR